MAEALARALFGGPASAALEITSAGLVPTAPDPLTLRVLAETGTDVSGLASKGLEALSAGPFDLVVRLGEAPTGSSPVAATRERHWTVPDPNEGASPAGEEERLLLFRSTRDLLHARILALGRELGLSARPATTAFASPRIAVVGWKNSGKTTLVERLVTELTRRGLRVATVKATHHDVEPDEVGKDSWRHRKAGAVESLLVGPHRWVLTREGGGSAMEAMARLGPVDLVVVEGLRGDDLPKIEVQAPDGDRPLLAPTDARVLLVAAERRPIGLDRPWRHRDDISGIADFILDRREAGELDDPPWR